MNKEKVISREYKIMLKVEKFQGETKKLLSACTLFWQDFQTRIAQIVPEIENVPTRLRGFSNITKNG